MNPGFVPDVNCSLLSSNRVTLETPVEQNSAAYLILTRAFLYHIIFLKMYCLKKVVSSYLGQVTLHGYLLIMDKLVWESSFRSPRMHPRHPACLKIQECVWRSNVNFVRGLYFLFS